VVGVLTCRAIFGPGTGCASVETTITSQGTCVASAKALKKPPSNKWLRRWLLIFKLATGCVCVARTIIRVNPYATSAISPKKALKPSCPPCRRPPDLGPVIGCVPLAKTTITPAELFAVAAKPPSRLVKSRSGNGPRRLLQGNAAAVLKEFK